MLRDMFTPEREIPAGMGFSLFGPAHLAVLALLGLLSALVILWGCHMRPDHRARLLRGMAVSMVVMEICIDLILGITGAFSVGYLPLHLCSVAMFICLYAAWHPRSDTVGQLLWSLCFSGGLAALLFPNWTKLPLWHFLSIHSFIYHAMLVQFSLIAVITGQARPRIGKLWKVGLFLVGIAIPVYWINGQLHTNYMFLNEPVTGSPLELCAKLPGQWGYLGGYALLVTAVLLMLNLPFSLGARWLTRKREM